MIRLLTAALLVAYLPGAALFRVPLGHRSLRGRLAADERVFWAVMLSAAWSLAVVLTLASVGWYAFERLLAVNGGVTLLVLIVWRGRLRYDGEAPRPSWSALIPVSLAALALWLYFPTAEYAMGGKDPGVYLNEGVQIAQRGSLVVRDPAVASLPPEFRDLFYPQHEDQHYYGLRFMGFFVQNPDDGSVVGQFPHLFPASVAIGYGLNGLSGAREAVGAWALVGLLAVYFAGARLFGRAVGAVAAGLLAVNVVEVWFARYPNSELLMQAFLFTAILAFAHALDGSRRFFGGIAGALVGLLLFLRYDAVLAYAAFTAAAVLAPVTRARTGVAFGWTLALLGLAGYWYLVGPMRAYAAYPLAFTDALGGWWLVGGGLAAGWVTRRLLRREAAAAVVRRLLPPGLALVLLGLAIYAYFFRQEGGLTAEHDAMAFRTFGWYITPWVLGLGVVGATAITATRFWTSPAFFLTFTTFSVFFFYKTRIVPEHFWAARRFLAMALPGTMLLLAAFVAEVARLLVTRTAAAFHGRGPSTEPAARRWLPAASTALLVVASAPIAAVFWTQAAPIRQHVEYAGLIPRLEQFAGRFGDRDLLVVESRNAGSDLHTLALPLAYVYARNVLLLDTPSPSKRMFEDFLTWARTQYAEVYFLGGAGTDLLTRRVTAEALDGERFQVPEYDSALKAYPMGVQQKEFEFGVYRLRPGDPLEAGPIDMAIGALDDLNVVRFHAREMRPDTGMTFRWTQDQSFVLLLGIAPEARRLTLWMSSGGRPPQAPSASVEVALQDRVLGSATPTDEVTPFSFDIPADIAAAAAERDDPTRLRLRVATWNPASVIGVNDTRDLGVIVTRVGVR